MQFQTTGGNFFSGICAMGYSAREEKQDGIAHVMRLVGTKSLSTRMNVASSNSPTWKLAA